jgi:hypothetical protein
MDTVQGSAHSKKKEDIKFTALRQKVNDGMPVGYSGQTAFRRNQCGM